MSEVPQLWGTTFLPTPPIIGGGGAGKGRTVVVLTRLLQAQGFLM